MSETDLKLLSHISHRFLKNNKQRSVFIDIGSIGVTHWNCFHVEDNNSSVSDSFGGPFNEFLLNQLPKQKFIIFIKFKLSKVDSVIRTVITFLSNRKYRLLQRCFKNLYGLNKCR